MNGTRSRWLAVLAGITFASAASAETQVYLTGGLTLTNIESDGLQEDLASLGWSASDEISDTAVGFQLGAGVQMTEIFGAELIYSDSGDAEDNIDVFVPFFGTVPLDVESSYDGFTLYGTAQVALNDRWDLYGKLGYTMQDLEVDVSGASESDDDDGFALAGGVRLHFNDHWAMTGELEYWAIDFDSSMKEPVRGSLNLQYLF